MAVNKPWWASLENRLFTIYKTKLNSSLLSDFPKLKCTTSPKSDSESRFPTAYFHMVDGIETGNDLNNTETNAIMATVQVDVYSNTSMSDCKEVILETINIIKSLRFNIIAMPIYTASNNLYTGTVRFRRVIGGDDDV